MVYIPVEISRGLYTELLWIIAPNNRLLTKNQGCFSLRLQLDSSQTKDSLCIIYSLVEFPNTTLAMSKP